MKTAHALAEFWGFDTVAKLLEPTVDSTTAKKDTPTERHVFTPNTINYFAGSPLNRYGKAFLFLIEMGSKR
jgi:NAD+ diphosphatase